MMIEEPRLEPLAAFCDAGCGCPQLFVDPTASADRRVVLTDDFGSTVRMSADQFGDLLTQAKSGALDGLQV